MNDEQPGATAEEEPSFVERLARRVGREARVSSVFGEPVERDGTTVIPVAKMRFGFGGGSGRKTQEQGGSGGGGGAYAAPIGYIEMSGGRTRFRRIFDPGAWTPFAIVMGLMLPFVLRRLRRR